MKITSYISSVNISFNIDKKRIYFIYLYIKEKARV